MKRLLKLARAHQRWLWAILGALWLIPVCIGFAMLADYSNRPTSTEPLAANWPAGSQIQPSSHGATLVLFAHPRCPCTRASLGELAKIVARHPGQLTPWVVFLKPEGVEGDWDQTDLLSTAESLPGVHVVRDIGGDECDRFRVTTSGQTLLFNNQGKLLFSGGITYARGHAGDNPGRAAIESFLAGHDPGYHETSAYGCPIASAAGPK